MKGSKRRPDQIAETIRQIVADAVIHEVRDPRVSGFVTITDVQVTNDLSYATIRFSVITEEETERQSALEGLKSAAGFFRSKVSQALSTRIVPELRFELDRGREHANRINEILGAIRQERGD